MIDASGGVDAIRCEKFERFNCIGLQLLAVRRPHRFQLSDYAASNGTTSSIRGRTAPAGGCRASHYSQTKLTEPSRLACTRKLA